MILNIYHTNDIHSNYDFLKKVHKYIRDNKTENDFYFDSGDYLDKSSYLVEADGGKSAMDLLMDAKLDMMTVGNNEMDLGNNKFENLLKQGYPIISSNIRDLQENDINGLAKSKILNKCGKRFLILGVTPYFSNDLSYASYNKYFTLGGMMTVNPLDTLRHEISDHEGQYDYIIFLSHSGHVVDPYLREHLPQLDLILGAHTHLIITEKNYTMSGRGQTLGKVSLDIKDDSIEIVDSIQINLDENVDNERFDLLAGQKFSHATSILSEQVEILENLDFDPLKENRLINFLCDALYKEYNVDLAIMQNGIAEGSLEMPLSKLDVIENFPSKLNPTIFQVSGKDLIKATIESFDQEFIRKDGFAAGFRGYILGTLSFSYNVQVVKNPFSDKNPCKITINGKELDLDKVYTIASTDYLQRGSGYKSLRSEDLYVDKDLVKDFILKYLQDDDLYNSSKIRRIH